MSGSRLWGFGLSVTADFPVVPCVNAEGRRADAPSVSLRWIGSTLPPGGQPADRTLVWETEFEGCPFRVEREAAGDHVFLWGDRASFRLGADLSTLDCAASDPHASDWRRLLLDTVLWCVSLLHGYELLHASAVVRDGAAVAFVAGSGGGKTSLAAELMRRGAALLCDDMVALTQTDGAIIGHPAPPVMNLPISTSERPQPSELGQVLATFPGEHWIAVQDAVSGPHRLTGICVIERRAGAATAVQRWTGAPLALLPQFVGFPETFDRLASQLDLTAAIAARVPVYLLSADPCVAPDQLASLVEDAVFRPSLVEV